MSLANQDSDREASYRFSEQKFCPADNYDAECVTRGEDRTIAKQDLNHSAFAQSGASRAWGEAPVGSQPRRICAGTGVSNNIL